MNELSRCRGMESLCRQRATFYPEESWKWLAEAEMWNHKAFERCIQHEESKAATSGIPSAGGDDFLRKIVVVPPKGKGNNVARREKVSAPSALNVHHTDDKKISRAAVGAGRSC